MSVFDINYAILRVQLLPVRLRKAAMKAWVKCMVSPVKHLYDRFRTSRSANLYTAAHNGQVVYLQAALNDLFDPIYRGIYLTDGLFADPLFVYMPPEDSPVVLGLSSEAVSAPFACPLTLYTSSETSLLGAGFVVNVPSAIYFDADHMKALLNKYRLPGRTVYSIVTY